MRTHKTVPPIKVWMFEDAPADLQSLSNHGGDEDWLAVVPKAYLDRSLTIGWLESGSAFGCCDVSQHPLPDGSVAYIGAHA